MKILLRKLITISDDYNQAIAYKNKQRRVTPPVYNENRLVEAPIPDIFQHHDVVPLVAEALVDEHQNHNDDEDERHENNEPLIQVATVENENESNVEQFGEQNVNGTVELVEVPASLNERNEEFVEQSFDNDNDPEGENNDLLTQFENYEPLMEIAQVADENESDTDNCMDPLDIKIDAINLVNQDISNEEIDTLGNFHRETFDDDLEIYFESAESFKPMKSSLQLKKNDQFSGALPYFIDVRIFFTNF